MPNCGTVVSLTPLILLIANRVSTKAKNQKYYLLYIVTEV
jgi:hypothetical protein